MKASSPSSPLQAPLKPSEGEAPFDLQTFVPPPSPPDPSSSLDRASEGVGTSPNLCRKSPSDWLQAFFCAHAVHAPRLCRSSKRLWSTGFFFLLKWNFPESLSSKDGTAIAWVPRLHWTLTSPFFFPALPGKCETWSVNYWN